MAASPLFTKSRGVTPFDAPSFKAASRLWRYISSLEQKIRQSILHPCELQERQSSYHHGSTASCRMQTYKALSLHHSISHPNSIPTHQIRHHDIREQAIAHNGNLVCRCHVAVRLGAEVGEDFGTATRLFDLVPKNLHAGVLLQKLRFDIVGVVACAGCVGYYEQTRAGVGVA